MVGILCIYPAIDVHAEQVIREEGIGSQLTDTTEDRTEYSKYCDYHI